LGSKVNIIRWYYLFLFAVFLWESHLCGLLSGLRFWHWHASPISWQFVWLNRLRNWYAPVCRYTHMDVLGGGSILGSFLIKLHSSLAFSWQFNRDINAESSGRRLSGRLKQMLNGCGNRMRWQRLIWGSVCVGSEKDWIWWLL